VITIVGRSVITGGDTETPVTIIQIPTLDETALLTVRRIA